MNKIKNNKDFAVGDFMFREHGLNIGLVLKCFDDEEDILVYWIRHRTQYIYSRTILKAWDIKN